ncbi:MAG: rRNA maturation RNase YbeY [Candidatus Spechtbacterales bacterium]|nr:rRNA maturation RNase YbeY [Candidatus Spechtbacterales bacterium]
MKKGSIVNETKLHLPENKILDCAEKVMQLHLDTPTDYTIVFVTPEKSKILNNKYYGKNTATDVLTFNEGDDYLGEIVICPSYIKESHPNTDEFYWELCHMAVHGMFHLVGLHHEEIEGGHEELHKKEIEIINEIF